MADTFEPKILGLFCTWCAYTGADLAGTRAVVTFQAKAAPARYPG